MSTAANKTQLYFIPRVFSLKLQISEVLLVHTDGKHCLTAWSDNYEQLLEQIKCDVSTLSVKDIATKNRSDFQKKAVNQGGHSIVSIQFFNQHFNQWA